MKTVTAFLSTVTLMLFLSPSAWSEPHLTFENPVHDFKKVSQGVVINHVFVFRNTGDTPAIVERVSSSCGCTVANVSSKVIQPGKKGEIKASFDTADFSGPVVKEVFVQINNPRKPVQTLTVKGTVIEEISVSPKQLTFMNIKPGVRSEMVLSIANNGKKTVRITSINCGIPQITAASSKTTLKPGESAIIKVSLNPGKESRYLSGYLTIVTDNQVKPPGKVIPVYAMVQR